MRPNKFRYADEKLAAARRNLTCGQGTLMTLLSRGSPSSIRRFMTLAGRIRAAWGRTRSKPTR